MEQLQSHSHIWSNICAFPQILGSPSSYMTLQLLLSEFYLYLKKIWFSFLSVCYERGGEARGDWETRKKTGGKGKFNWARICKRLRSPESDSKKSLPPAYVAWRAGTSNRVIIPARQAGNRFLGSLQVLQIRALEPQKKIRRGGEGEIG